MMAYELKKHCNFKCKSCDYRCILCGISKNDVVDGLNNSVLEDKCVL